MALRLDLTNDSQTIMISHCIGQAICIHTLSNGSQGNPLLCIIYRHTDIIEEGRACFRWILVSCRFWPHFLPIMHMSFFFIPCLLSISLIFLIGHFGQVLFHISVTFSYHFSLTLFEQHDFVSSVILANLFLCEYQMSFISHFF